MGVIETPPQTISFIFMQFFIGFCHKLRDWCPIWEILDPPLRGVVSFVILEMQIKQYDPLVEILHQDL